MRICIILVIHSVLLLKGDTKENLQISVNDNVPFGDKRNCFSQFSSTSVKKFGTLPGIGWDNLQNEYAGMIIHFNFSKCRTTDDGKYLLPDNVFTIPIKSSNLEISGELFSHWTNYTSLTSSSINMKGGLQVGKFDISGKFSEESTSVRTKQEREKSQTTRVQARYVIYAAKLERVSPLSDSFVSRIKSIANNLQWKRHKVARYESELLVRDFGTHIVTSTDIGAVIAQVSEIKSSFFENGNIDKSDVIASAGLSFANVTNMNMSTGYNQNIENKYFVSYEKHKSHSVIETYGGPVFKPNDFSLNEWASEIDDDFVVVNRNGYPIYELITSYNLPDIPSSLMYKIVHAIKLAVERYYKFNTYKGCTNSESPNFSYISNVDDGTCETPYTNFTFGGVYTECYQSEHSGITDDLCAEITQINPLTGKHSCPNGYEAVKLNSGSNYVTKTITVKHSCGALGMFDCYKKKIIEKSSTYNSYWCVTNREIPQQSGFLFGGVFTSTVDNLLTQDHSCPAYFYHLSMGEDFHVCVSDDYELGYPFSVPFAGFYSCKAGNPLAILPKPKTSSKKQELLHSMESYLRTSDSNSWPKGCPDGYASHLGTVENSCEISFCVKVHSFSVKRFPTIRKPPYMKLPTDTFVESSNFSESLEITSNDQFHKL